MKTSERNNSKHAGSKLKTETASQPCQRQRTKCEYMACGRTFSWQNQATQTRRGKFDIQSGTRWSAGRHSRPNQGPGLAYAGIWRATALGFAAARSSILVTVRGTSGGGGLKARTAMKVPRRLSTCKRRAEAQVLIAEFVDINKGVEKSSPIIGDQPRRAVWSGASCHWLTPTCCLASKPPPRTGTTYCTA